jgi:hypothetical protein
VKPLAALCCAILVCSCSNDAADAEEEYRIVESTGDLRARCKKSGEVADTYLRQKNETKYREWKIRNGGDCAMADLRREGLM